MSLVDRTHMTTYRLPMICGSVGLVLLWVGLYGVPRWMENPEAVARSQMVLVLGHGAFCFFCILIQAIKSRRASTDHSNLLEREAELQQMGERFRTLVETSSDWIWELDVEAKFTYVGPQVKTILGYEPEELVGTSGFALMPSDEAARISEKFAVYVDNETPFFNMDNVNLHKDGHRVILESSGIPYYDAHGQLMGYRGVDRDITDRKLSEDLMASRLRLLTRPVGDVENEISLNDLFDLEEVQRLQDAFALAANVASIITDTEGIPITKPSNFCRLCSDIIRKTEKGLANCICSDKMLGRQHPGGPIMQPCLSGGLWDGGASICVGDRHIANWLIGQVRNDAQNKDEMMDYCRSIEADEEAFRSALNDVPIMSTEQFKLVCEELFLFANHLSKMAYQNLQQGRFIAEIQQSEQALRESEENYREIFDSSSNGIMVLDVDSGMIQDVNTTLLTMLRAEEREQILKRHPSFFNAPSGSASRESWDQWVAASATQGPQGLEWKAKRLNGDLFWGDVSLKRVRLAGNARILVIVNDISIRKQSERQQKELEEQLRQSQKMEAIGQLAGGVAHDFNNLLVGIMGNAELLKMNLEASSDEAGFAQQIEKASLRAADLTKQLLAFSRKGALESSSVDVHECISEVVKLLQHSIDKRIKIECQFADLRAVVMGDGSQLQNAILNLGVNARDAMPEGGDLTFSTGVTALAQGSQSFHMETLPAGAYLEVCVSDTGMGMTEKVLERMYEPFFTTKPMGKGTGLGLASVYGCIQRHKGHIEVESQIGKGSTFRVFLPLAEPTQARAFPANAASVPMTGEGRILVVDDEEDIRIVSRQLLHNMGYSVVACCDGQEAVEYVTAHRAEIDLVVLDVIMPRMGGKDAFTAIHSLDPELPVLICSGFAQNETVRDMLDGGAKAFLKKPYRIEELSDKVSCYIRRT